MGLKSSIRLGMLVVVWLVLVATSATAETMRQAAPLTNDGILDLRNWNFETDGALRLDGEWLIIWREFVAPEDFANHDSIETARRAARLARRQISRHPFRWNRLCHLSTSHSSP